VSDTDARALMLSRPVAMIRGITPGYFAASGTPIRGGRLLSDTEAAEVAVVSESLVRRLWPGEVAQAVIGRQFRQGNVKGPTVTIVGVVADARPGGVDRDPPPVIYRPYPQWASGPMTLLVRTAVEPSALGREVRSVIRSMDPDLPLIALRTMREVVWSTVAERRFQMALTVVFAIVALALGAIGLYGVVSYSVACRTREIGLRLALGAQRRDVMRSVFSQGLNPVVGGLVVGLAAAIAVARALRSLLFGVTPTDPLSLGSVVFVLLLASAVACYVPARRAAKLDPLLALRHE
jgi:predicted permease